MRKILVVDDQPAIRNMLADLLKSNGYEFVLAENGNEGVRLAQESRPDLILMDLMMPQKNGLDAAKEIKAIPELVHIPILFLTARGQESDHKRAIEAGGSGLMMKPFSPKMVLAKIVELLNKPAN